MGFSQGSYIISCIYKARQYFKNEFPLRHPLPSFVIDFSGPKLPHLNNSLVDRFISSEFFVPGCESVHFKGRKDTIKNLSCEVFYEKPIVFWHNRGHAICQELPRSELGKLAQFLER